MVKKKSGQILTETCGVSRKQSLVNEAIVSGYYKLIRNALSEPMNEIQ